MRTEQYSIPTFNLGKLNKKLSTINRRALRNGIPQVTLTETGRRFIPDPNQPAGAIQAHKAYGLPCVMIELVDFTFTGDDLKIAGWTFLGTLDHTSMPGHVIVQSVPGQKVPQSYFHAPAVCDHCGQKRHRNETFVVRHDNGEEKQVGRNCLELFFGRDPHAVLQQLSRLWQFIKELSDEEKWYGGSGNYPTFYPLDWVLGRAASVIRQNGWVSRAMADEHEGMRTTASWVSEMTSPPYRATDEEMRTWEAMVRKYEPTEGDLAEVAQVVTWWNELPERDSSYEHNCKTFARDGQVPVQMFGYACSMVSTWQKAMDRLMLKKAQPKRNEYVGSVGQRMDIQVQVVALHDAGIIVEGFFRPRTFYKMKDLEGRTLVWYKSGDPEMERGQSYVIRGTVKDQRPYVDQKGVSTNTTYLTRVTVNKTIPANEAPQVVPVGAVAES
jgi:hypothetical protein